MVVVAGTASPVRLDHLRGGRPADERQRERGEGEAR